MKRILPIIFAVAAAMPAQAQTQDRFKFVDSLRLDCPSVQDQQMSGTCWCFSTMSFIESEMMHNGNPNPPNLSEMYVVRQNYIDRAQKHVMLHGKMNFGQGSYFHDNMSIINKHGIVPEEAYPNTLGEGGINHYPLERRLTQFVDSVADNNLKKIDPAWIDAYTDILDSYLGTVPETFQYDGKTYTPQSFAKEVVKLNINDYVQVTSFSHHEFGKYCVLELPDNWRAGKFLNVTIDDLIAIIDASLAKGHTVL
ncbi:MAG: hypothetical protein J5595_01735 [Bacteroidales bacterium]|nr:hypothetical protein [Bacteroidales bacterium]